MVRRTGCFVAEVVRCVDVADRVVVLRAAGLVVDVAAGVDSRDAAVEREADCRLGLGEAQAARPISVSPTRRILDISPPTAWLSGAS